MSKGKQIKILTLNVRGIVLARKRRRIFLCLEKQNVDIIFLQKPIVLVIRKMNLRIHGEENHSME